MAEIRALTFDVFGTVVDWRGSIVAEGEALSRRLGVDVDWAAFADEWRAGYGPAMDRVRRGNLPWTMIDDLHRMILDGLLGPYGLAVLDETEIDHLNRAWHRLKPWPDAVPGLTRLKTRYAIATLSNGNVELLANMAAHSGLPWDHVLSAEQVRHYKPDPEVYLGAAESLGVPPEQVMMVAAHERDVRAARSVGFRTAFVYRPLEYGEAKEVERPSADAFDLVVDDFEQLAAKLGT
jgi:2-haloacid dehalogenase